MRALKALHSDGTERVIFCCPGCGDRHQVTVGVHGRWGWNGSLDLPTFEGSVLVGGVQWPTGEDFYKPEHASVTAGGRTVCHSFVRDGRIEFLGDSTHDLAGQTVDLPDFA